MDLIWQMYTGGYSSGEIAKALKKTRNAVCGHIHRVKIKNGHVPIKRSRNPKNIVPKTVIRKFQSQPRYERECQCQYINDGIKCLKPSHGSWCEEHKRVVYARKSTIK